MAKLDELAEVLTEEIANFEKSIEELKKQASIIQNSAIEPNELKKIIEDLKQQTSLIPKLKVKPDLSGTIKIFNQFIEIQQKNHTTFLTELKTTFSTLKVNKNKATKHITYLLSIITLISLLLSFTINNNLKEHEAIAYQKGKKDLTNYINLFFNDNPRSEKEFLKWSNNK